MSYVCYGKQRRQNKKITSVLNNFVEVCFAFRLEVVGVMNSLFILLLYS
jgi:hypothetical protein